VTGAAAPTRVVRIIARLNIGGPAIQAISLTRSLEPLHYATILVRGTEEAREGTMDPLAHRLGVRPRRVPSLRRAPGWHDLRALGALVRIIARERPQIVHTHAAKAGTLGRIAAIVAPGRSGRVLVHTFHGHSLRGYFSPRTARFYLIVERLLARRTTRLVAVSEEVRDDLVSLGVAPLQRFEVIPLGFDLSSFSPPADQGRRRARLRAELGIPADLRLITIVARLVPIKRVDRFLRIACQLADRADVHFLIVGDGELRQGLRASPEARALADRVTWAGFRADMPDIYFASDVVVLTSDNEGTPVSLIEALAAGVPVVSSRVGGVPSVVRNGQTGLTDAAQDEDRLGRAVGRLLDQPELALRLASQGREHALGHFSIDTLVSRTDRLYCELLTGAGP
jgi:glycosyltransferase involved in cell wall biosynthesis